MIIQSVREISAILLTDVAGETVERSNIYNTGPNFDNFLRKGRFFSV